MATRNVVLTGFMGTGKTTIGRLLASRLGFEFVDTDAVIVERHGSIPAIFAERGEGAFRRMERDVADELAGRRGLVVATGGRMLVDAVNAERLGGTGDVFCLVASVDTILERVDADGAAAVRPLLAGENVRERLEHLLAEREEAYGRFRQVDTDRRDPDDVADEIIGLVAAGVERDDG